MSNIIDFIPGIASRLSDRRAAHPPKRKQMRCKDQSVPGDRITHHAPAMEYGSRSAGYIPERVLATTGPAEQREIAMKLEEPGSNVLMFVGDERESVFEREWHQHNPEVIVARSVFALDTGIALEECT